MNARECEGLAALSEGEVDRSAPSSQLFDGLFEFRFTLGPTARRITYRFTEDGRLVLLTTPASASANWP